MKIEPLIYFRTALFVPVILPLIFMLIVRLLGVTRLVSMPDFLGKLFMLPILSIVFGGGIYLLFALVMYWLIGKLTISGVVIQVLLSPVYFAAIVFLVSMLWGVMIGDQFGGMQVGVLAGFYALVLGYAYVMVTLIGYFLLSL